MKSYKKALEVLKQGGVIIFPTDTVMGIGCAMNKPEAIEKMYEIKKRPKDQPTAILVSDVKMAKSLMSERADKFLGKIMKKYWPGGLTIVVKAAENVPKSVTGGTDRAGVRMPDFPKLQEMIQKLGSPLVATSANFKGDPTPVTFNEIKREFLSLVDYAIDEDSTGTEASTVIKYFGGGRFEYLRRGDIILKEK